MVANVGDQFGRTNQHLMSRAYSWYYMGINVGSATSSLATPGCSPITARRSLSASGFFMALATLVFWMGRYRFVHIPPAGKTWLKDIAGPEGVRVVKRLAIIYVLAAAFWSLFDQMGSSWVLQAENMDACCSVTRCYPASCCRRILSWSSCWCRFSPTWSIRSLAVSSR